MKGKFTKIMSLVLAAVVAFGMLGVSTSSAYAASAPKLVPETRWANCEYMYGIEFDDSAVNANAKILKIWSKNTKVMEASKDGSSVSDTVLTPKKTGKAVIYVKYKYKGKTKTTHATYKVKAYPKQIKELKVNGKSVKISKSNGNRFFIRNYGYKEAKATVKYTLAKGWKVQDAYYINDKEEYKSLKKSALTKGKTFKIGSSEDAYICIFINAVNSKGEVIQHSVQFFRESLD